MRSPENPVHARWAAAAGCIPSRTTGPHSRDEARRLRGTKASWGAMVERCTIEGGKGYPEYGARGIGLCDRWRSFDLFLQDMGPRPEGTTIDRRDRTRGYEPDNCRWATRKEQAVNRSSTVLLTWNEKAQCISDWAAELGIPRQALYYRISRAGWSVEKALSTPSRKVLDAPV
ncbi:hypothetical protein N234_06710 [Ralstonia pickettii DTP0602]|nr:hypothetical protein N234_06710 [Ralstonia pickettii DTP0602]